MASICQLLLSKFQEEIYSRLGQKHYLRIYRVESHIEKRDDALVRVSPLLELIADWNEFLNDEFQEKEYQELRQHKRTGWPLGSDLLIEKI